MKTQLRKSFSILLFFLLVLSACRPTVTTTPNPTVTSAPSTSPNPAATATADSHAAEITELQGAAEARANTAAEWSAASLGQTLIVGNQVRTGADSLATIRFSEGALTRLAPDSLFT